MLTQASLIGYKFIEKRSWLPSTITSATSQGFQETTFTGAARKTWLSFCMGWKIHGKKTTRKNHLLGRFGPILRWVKLLPNQQKTENDKRNQLWPWNTKNGRIFKRSSIFQGPSFWVSVREKICGAFFPFHDMLRFIRDFIILKKQGYCYKPPKQHVPNAWPARMEPKRERIPLDVHLFIWLLSWVFFQNSWKPTMTIAGKLT